MRILIINRFMPPDEAPTSVLAGELAEHLAGSGHEVECVASSTNYRAGKGGGLHRIAGELNSHLVLFAKMLTARRADMMLCLSSPTCLAVTAAAAALIRGERFAHWAMDVYPEVAVQLGEIRAGGLVHRITEKLMNWAYGRANVLVALDEDMRELFAQKGHTAAICRPWTPLSLQWPSTDIATPAPRPLRWVYSGNLGRAHEWEALLLAQQLLETESPGQFELVFQGGGANRQPAQTRARELGLQHCHWTEYAPREALLESLFEADVLIATQNPATKGLLWPSKLAVMQYVPRPVLWVGPENSAVATELASRMHSATIAVGSEAPEQIARWLQQLVATPPHLRCNAYSPPNPVSLRRPITELEDILVS